jgi:putative endonuclease
MAFVYILYSEKPSKFYVGACTELERRLYEHNIGHSKFTSLGIPWNLVYKEHYEDLKSAKKREKEIKRKKSGKYIEKLVGSSAGRTLPIRFIFL